MDPTPTMQKTELSFHKYPMWWGPMELALNTSVHRYPPQNIEGGYCKAHNVLVVYMSISAMCFLGAYGCTYECMQSGFMQRAHTNVGPWVYICTL
jgi:hypothetical protein